jgi:hypothetical protein
MREISSAASPGSNRFGVQEELTYKRYSDWQDVARLVTYCFLEHLPYRQLHMV